MPKKRKKYETMLSDEAYKIASIYSPARRNFLLKAPESLSVGGRIRRERILRNLSLEKMADYLEISPSYLGALERGTRPISRKMMDRFHDRLNISYDFMLEGISISGSMISQYVKESATYSAHHNLNVLLNVCNKEELESCYNLVHTFLTYRRNVQSNRTDPDPSDRNDSTTRA